MIGFIVGYIVGSVMGSIVICLCISAKDREDK